MSENSADRLVDEPTAAKHLAMSKSKLQKLRYSKSSPPYVQNGRQIRYSISDLDAFIAAHKRRFTPDE